MMDPDCRGQNELLSDDRRRLATWRIGERPLVL